MPPVAPSPVNYYKILGIPPTADIAMINTAFRRLAWRCHPDRNPAPDATVQFQNISEARNALSDPVRRARYDAASYHRSGSDGSPRVSSSQLRRRSRKKRRRPARIVTLMLVLALIPTFWAALHIFLMRLHSGSSLPDSTTLNNVSSSCELSLRTSSLSACDVCKPVSETSAIEHNVPDVFTLIVELPGPPVLPQSTVMDVYASEPAKCKGADSSRVDDAQYRNSKNSYWVQVSGSSVTNLDDWE